MMQNPYSMWGKPPMPQLQGMGGPPGTGGGMMPPAPQPFAMPGMGMPGMGGGMNGILGGQYAHSARYLPNAGMGGILGGMQGGMPPGGAKPSPFPPQGVLGMTGMPDQRPPGAHEGFQMPPEGGYLKPHWFEEMFGGGGMGGGEGGG